MGVSVGAGIAFIVGGQVIGFVTSSPPISLPFIGELYAWQTVFLFVGLPGLAIAALMGTVREPVRRGKIKLESNTDATNDQISREIVDSERLFPARTARCSGWVLQHGRLGRCRNRIHRW